MVIINAETGERAPEFKEKKGAISTLFAVGDVIAKGEKRYIVVQIQKIIETVDGEDRMVDMVLYVRDAIPLEEAQKNE